MLPAAGLVWAPGFGGGVELVADLEKLDLPLMPSPAGRATVLGEAIYYCCDAPASPSVLLLRSPAPPAVIAAWGTELGLKPSQQPCSEAR